MEPEADLHNEAHAEDEEDHQERHVLCFVDPPDAGSAQNATSFIVGHGGRCRRVQRCGVPGGLSPRSTVRSGFVMAALDHSCLRLKPRVNTNQTQSPAVYLQHQFYTVETT